MEPLYDEDDLLPLSGLAHMAFCERRWALVHVEGQWQENRYTLEGREGHERAHSGELESRPGLLIRRALPLRSLRLGLSGQSDVVEFHQSTGGHAVSLPGLAGKWQPLPIEYKRSRDKAGSIAYRLQLCAQAMCLEEMLGACVSVGAVYDVSTRRRETVVFATAVRQEVVRLAARMHAMRRSGETPAALQKPACAKCSLKEVCVPGLNASGKTSVARYLKAAIRQAVE
jgi:CRISPR-associated exonuclease Cas4